jgi:hypothetical protein
MSLATKRLLVLGAVAAYYVTDAVAIPVSYNFTTGMATSAIDTDPSGATAGGLNADLLAILAGLTVTGSFVYDSDSAVTTVVHDSTGTQTQYLYDSALTNLVGTVGGFGFSDPAGRIQLSDDGILLPTPTGPVMRDLLQLSGGSTDLIGFTIDSLGLTLRNARLFWIEGNPSGLAGESVPDILTSYELPALLPSTLGLFGFTLGSPDGSPRFSNVTFSSLSVTPVSVPEPSTLALLGLGGLLLFGARQRRETRV